MTPVIAILAGLAVLLVAAPRQRVPYVAPAPPAPADHGLLFRLRVPLSALCVVGTWFLLGGTVGTGVGLAAAMLAWRALGSAEGPAARRRREELEAGLPFAVHLLGACLRSGAPVSTALDAVAGAIGGEVAVAFGRLHARLALGSDPVEVWTDVAEGGPLAPLGRSLLRAHRSGSSVTTAVDRLAEDLGTVTRSRAQSRARTVEVRAAAPLGLCLLPSFVLLGVVPLTAGLFGSLDLFG